MSDDLVAAVVLAAGGSRRMGRPKQLLEWGRETLLGHVVGKVRSWPVDEIWVVLGHEVDRIMAVVDLSGAGVIDNPEWEEGLASSIRVALDALTRHSRAEWALLCLGDQPEIGHEVVTSLLEAAQRTTAAAVVPKYRYTWGNPVLVRRTLWPRLMSLEGDQGARRLLQAHPEWVEEVWFETLPPRDVDSEVDAEELRPRSTT